MADKRDEIGSGDWSFEKLSALLSVAHESVSDQLETVVLAIKMLKHLRESAPVNKARKVARASAKEICDDLHRVTGLKQFDWGSAECVGKKVEQIISRRFEEFILNPHSAKNSH